MRVDTGWGIMVKAPSRTRLEKYIMSHIRWFVVEMDKILNKKKIKGMNKTKVKNA